MEGYIAAVLFGGAALTAQELGRGSAMAAIYRGCLWAAALAASLSLLIALSIGEWLSLLWSAGLLANSLAVLGVTGTSIAGRQVAGGLAVALGLLTASLSAAALWGGSLMPETRQLLVGLSHRQDIPRVLIGDFALGATACVIGGLTLIGARNSPPQGRPGS